MDGVDLGLFDFDRHNTLYYFVLNAQEQIYLRYGGRTAESPTSRLSLESLVVALEKGLEQHRLYQQGRFEEPARAPASYPSEIEGLRESTIRRGRCVECHLIADYRASDQERAGRLNKIETMFASPDLETLGIYLDPSDGVLVSEVEGVAAQAGLLAGDRIVELDGERVLTFGDLQYRYDKLPRDSRVVTFGIERGGRSAEIDLALPPEWWVTDLFFRYWSVEPQLYFSSDRLTADRKASLGLDPDGFACEVRFVERRAAAFGHHDLRPGDIVFAVDGSTANAVTSSCELHLKLETVAGTMALLRILRDGEAIEMPFRSGRQNFRKPAGRSGGAR